MLVAELAAAVIIRLFAPAVKEAAGDLAGEALEHATAVGRKIYNTVRDLLVKQTGTAEVLDEVEAKKVDPKVLQDLLETLLAKDQATADALAALVKEHAEVTNTGNIVNIDASQHLSQVWAQTITGPVVNYGATTAAPPAAAQPDKA